MRISYERFATSKEGSVLVKTLLHDVKLRELGIRKSKAYSDVRYSYERGFLENAFFDVKFYRAERYCTIIVF